VDASPISIREYWVALGNLPSFIELIARAKRVRSNLRISDAIRCWSGGYRTVGMLTQRLAILGNTRVANLIAALLLPGAPFESTLEAIFSPTATAVNPVGEPVDTPITERRIASAARSIGDSIKQIARSKQDSAKAFLSRNYNDYVMGFKGGRSVRLVSGLMDQGIAPFLAYRRAWAILDRHQDMDILLNVANRLHGGGLRSRGFISLLGKIIPLWTYAIGDVSAIPMPEAFEPSASVLRRARLQKLLRLRVQLLGLRWHKSHVTSSKSNKTPTDPQLRSKYGRGGQHTVSKADSRRVRQQSSTVTSTIRETIE
jgi:hypothetical protein